MELYPATYLPYVTAGFLSALVLVIVGPFKGRIGAEFLPLVGMLIALALHLLIAWHVGVDLLRAGLAAIDTALVAAGVYHAATTASEAGRKRIARRQARAVQDGAAMMTTTETEPLVPHG